MCNYGNVGKMDEETIKNFLNKKNTIGFIGATIQKEKWGYKKYKKRFYRTPPIPFTYKKSDIYVCSGSVLDILGFENEIMY